MGVDVDGFDRWYLQLHPVLLSSLLVAAGDPDEAREATDEAFARAFERWPRVRDMESPAGWVFRTALNVVKRRARRQSLERRLLGRLAPEVEAPMGWSVEVLDSVRALPERERVAIALRYVADLSTAQIAAVMGIAPGTVGSTLFAGRRRMAMALGDDPADVDVVELEEVFDGEA
jgi:RNA polymerase sigma-70 factor (ECF subfamily)